LTVHYFPGSGGRIGRKKGSRNSKLHALTGGGGKPLILLLSEGQMSDHKGAMLMLPALPKAKSLTGDRDYDSGWFREASIEKGSSRASLRKEIRVFLDLRDFHSIERLRAFEGATVAARQTFTPNS
jgi:hypothetical protein